MDSKHDCVSRQLTTIDKGQSEYSIFVAYNVSVCDNFQEIDRLIGVVNDIQSFSDCNSCIEFIVNNKNEKILFITSELFGASIIPQIHHLPQINAIYFSYLDKGKHQKWAKIYKKNEAGDGNLLCYLKLKKFCRYPVIRIDILGIKDKPFSSLNKLDKSFMYAQLIKETILKMQDNDIKDMIEYCRNHFADNEQSLKVIAQLEREYNEDMVIDWYTQSLLHNIINTALRTQDIDIIYAFRVFIRHLHEQLIKLSWESYESPIKLFRGQQLESDELEKMRNNQGGLISFAQFLSTSKKQDVAEIFGGGPSVNSTTEAVLFHMQIDFTLDAFPASGIGNFSHMGLDEDEFLFTMGSIFRIENIEQDNKKIWHIHLSYSGDNDRQLGKLTEQMGKTIGHKNPIIQLARLMYEKGKWDKAEKFYKKAYETETDWKQKVVILTNLGVGHRQREQLEKALSYYEQALEVGRNYTNDEYDPIFSGVFNNIGLIYCKKKDFLPAIENMQRALKIEETIPERTQEHIASIYLNIGFIFLEQHNYEQSFENLQHSLDIFLQIFPSETNGQIAMLYDNMARCFAGITNWSKAIEYAQKAVDIDIQLLPYEHDHAKRHRDNLEAYRKKKEEWQRHKFSKYLFYLAQILKKIFVFILNMKLY